MKIQYELISNIITFLYINNNIQYTRSDNDIYFSLTIHDID